MTWEGRAPFPVAGRALAVGLAIGVAVTVATLVRPEAILLLVVTIPVAFLATRSRVTRVTLEGARLIVACRGRESHRLNLETGGRVKAVLCRWTGPAAVSRGLALRFPTDRVGLVIGAAGTKEEPLVRGRILPICDRVDVVLPPQLFGELARALAVGLDEAGATAGRGPAPAPDGRGSVFELWVNPRFPFAFVGACLVTVGLGVLARFAFGVTAHAWRAGAGPVALVLAGAFLIAGAVYDVVALSWRPRSPVLILSVVGDELVIAKKTKDRSKGKGGAAPLVRTPLLALRVAKATWERPQADMPEINWRRLPSLKVTASPQRTLTIGAGVEPWSLALSGARARPSSSWTGNLPRTNPPQYLALAEDWPLLVALLTSLEAPPAGRPSR